MRTKNLFILLIITIICIDLVSSIGMSPIRYRFKFTPYLSKSLSFAVYNENSHAIDAHLYVKGQLSQYVELDREVISLEPGQGGFFNANMRLPEFIEPPGEHRILVGAKESAVGGPGVSAVAAIQIPIYIEVAYPGKYLALEFSSRDVEINESIPFTISYQSKGKEHINSLKAEIKIYDTENNYLASLFTEEKPVSVGASGTLQASWNPEPSMPGEYIASAIITYDDTIRVINTTFHISELEMQILNITKYYEKDTIAPFSMAVISRWNKPLHNVYADVKIYSALGGLDGNFKTPFVDVAPWTPSIFSTFWDTNNIPVGKYNATVVLYYQDKNINETHEIEVMDKLPEPVEEQPFVFPWIPVLVALVILLFIFNIFWFIKTSKKEKKKEAPPTADTKDKASEFKDASKKTSKNPPKMSSVIKKESSAVTDDKKIKKYKLNLDKK